MRHHLYQTGPLFRGQAKPARDGRVELLFVAEEAHIVGTADPEAGEGEVGRDGEDLLDRATAEALAKGACACALPKDWLPALGWEELSEQRRVAQNSNSPDSEAVMKIPQRHRGNGSTSEELRHDIDSGRTGDKVSAADPTATPLGTDDEAAGYAPDRETVSRARQGERSRIAGVPGIASRAQAPRPGRSLVVTAALLAVLALLVVGLFVAL